MSSSISIVLIPSDASKPLRTHRVSWDEKRNVNSRPFASKVHHRILSLLHDGERDDDIESSSDLSAIDDRVEVPLLRPLGDSPGLYAYFRSDVAWTNKIDSDKESESETTAATTAAAAATPNIRATRLAMACGVMTLRFVGNVVVARSNPSGRPRWSGVTERDLWQACEVSPDLRPTIRAELALDVWECANDPGGDDPSGVDSVSANPPVVPLWMKNAAEQNYHDAAVVARMAEVMNSEEAQEDGDSETDDDDEDDNDDDDENDDDDDDSFNNNKTSTLSTTKFTAKSPLCLHCRRPTNNLCEGCGGAYFCPPPLDCGNVGWSHSCQCRTWKSYVSRREELSAFEYLDPDWQAPLVGREFQLSEEPYKKFLASRLMIKGSEEEECKGDETSSSLYSSWWLTETDGWAGGDSASARQVDVARRSTFEQGFAPIPSDQLPPSRRVCDGDYERAGLPKRGNPKNAVGLWKLSSWEDYYRLRNIPPQSPVALLCTFPLTIYRAIVEYGEVPVTVARMLRRPLRIHVVGTEKELNFLDLFQELGFLLPEDLQIELVFVAREDMLPKKCKTGGSNDDDCSLLRVELTSNLTVAVVGGTYGGETRNDPSRSTSATRNSGAAATILDPNFDCGSGPPDMVVAMNAGLYAYESWRSVVDYLYHNKGVVGVFTDYNEYSGVHCAGLGGAASRESLCINPFRQPLAMPVYSMNLPQFSNGFFYVFNAQELD